MRHSRHNRLFEAIHPTISLDFEYFGASGAPDDNAGGGDDADAAAKAAEEAARARGDLLEETKDTSTKDEKVDTKDEKVDADDKTADKTTGKTADELSEEEGEETAEEKAQREAEEVEAEKNKRIRVPKWRLDELAAKARAKEEALQARIKELEKKDEPAKKDVLAEMRTQIGELQDKYEAHVFEGEKDKAKEVRKQLDELREKYTDTKVAQTGALARAQTLDQLKYEAALAKVETDYPALNPDHADTFDEAKANEVGDLLAMFVQNGMTRQAALEKAVKYVMGTPAQKKEAGKDATAETLRQKQEQEARKKAAEAAKKQPPDSNAAGVDNDKAGGNREQGIDVLKLSQEKFAKLDEETLAKMRGDVLA